MFKNKLKQLEAMEEIILCSDNEDLAQTWLKEIESFYTGGSPLEYIASDDNAYTSLCDFFVELLSFHDFTV